MNAPFWSVKLWNFFHTSSLTNFLTNFFPNVFDIIAAPMVLSVTPIAPYSAPSHVPNR